MDDQDSEFHERFLRLFTAHEPAIRAYVRRLVPTRDDAVNDKRLVLHSGRLSANVPPQGVGFTVETPEAEVIDYGTEFSVEVAPGASEVHVFEGLVRVRPKAKKSGDVRDPIEVQTKQAVKIDEATQEFVDIEVAKDRFIRTFDEPQDNYPRSVKSLGPVAFYRMAIRDQGLASDPPRHSGVVLTGEGRRPPHACGVLKGGSLRVLADSTGRGGRVDLPPKLHTGHFTLTVFVYLDAPAPGGTVATNVRGEEGTFELALDDKGRLRVTTRSIDGALRSVACESLLPPHVWRHVVVTADGDQFRIYEDGQLAGAMPCAAMANSDSEPVWFGVNAEGAGLWNGRIDEVAIFDKALSEKDITRLYQAALAEITRSK